MIDTMVICPLLSLMFYFCIFIFNLVFIFYFIHCKIVTFIELYGNVRKMIKSCYYLIFRTPSGFIIMLIIMFFIMFLKRFDHYIRGISNMTVLRRYTHFLLTGSVFQSNFARWNIYLHYRVSI